MRDETIRLAEPPPAHPFQIHNVKEQKTPSRSALAPGREAGLYAPHTAVSMPLRALNIKGLNRLDPGPRWLARCSAFGADTAYIQMGSKPFGNKENIVCPGAPP